VVSDTLAAIAGVTLASRTGIAVPRGAEPHLLDAFAACYLGTLASPTGGMSVPGTVIGALFVSFLSNGLTILGLGAAPLDRVTKTCRPLPAPRLSTWKTCSHNARP
jgi:ribose/xylose/arabinose/galactoside ABC-type transport system permease subunit